MWLGPGGGGYLYSYFTTAVLEVLLKIHQYQNALKNRHAGNPSDPLSLSPASNEQGTSFIHGEIHAANWSLLATFRIRDGGRAVTWCILKIIGRAEFSIIITYIDELFKQQTTTTKKKNVC